MRMLALLIACSGLLLSCGESPPAADQYPGNWETPTIDVIGVLARNEVRGCGEFYQQANVHFSGEYIVACRGRTERDWSLYQVWPRIDRVQRLELSVLLDVGGPPGDELRARD